jgi:hypothetical protein
MTSDASAKVPAKRIKPYPFEGLLEHNGAKLPVAVLHVATEGVIVKLSTQFVKVGEHCQLVFELPVLQKFVNSAVRVLKTYDKAVNLKEHHVERLAEFHFEKLSEEYQGYIQSFLRAITQKK